MNTKKNFDAQNKFTSSAHVANRTKKHLERKKKTLAPSNKNNFLGKQSKSCFSKLSISICFSYLLILPWHGNNFDSIFTVALV